MMEPFVKPPPRWLTLFMLIYIAFMGLLVLAGLVIGYTNQFVR